MRHSWHSPRAQCSSQQFGDRKTSVSLVLSPPAMSGPHNPSTGQPAKASQDQCSPAEPPSVAAGPCLAVQRRKRHKHQFLPHSIILATQIISVNLALRGFSGQHHSSIEFCFHFSVSNAAIFSTIGDVFPEPQPGIFDIKWSIMAIPLEQCEHYRWESDIKAENPLEASLLLILYEVFDGWQIWFKKTTCCNIWRY